MTPKKKRRLAFAIALIAAGMGSAGLAIVALKDNVLYFYSPRDVLERHVLPGVTFRIGGLVEKNSVRHAGVATRFIVTDGVEKFPVEFGGVLPALFRDGQGVVAVGSLDQNGLFKATDVMAKHDERYMPPEVVDALKRSGHWKDG